MSDSGMSYQSCSTRQNDRSHGCGYWHGEPWKPVEILAMVLGFIVYWPIGFAVLGWKFWQKKSGYPGDIISFAREKWANWAHGSDRRGFAVKNWAASGFGMGSTGNRAFDEWPPHTLQKSFSLPQRAAGQDLTAFKAANSAFT
jgi:hypothetical protein